jgi:hypothetical protein
MPGAAIPTEDAMDMAVEDFGIGMYDVPKSKFDHGEDSEDLKSEAKPKGTSLPDGGGPENPYGTETFLSYPQTFATFRYDDDSIETALAELPGDIDRPPRSRRLQDDTLQTVVSESAELPDDSDNPSSRSDYYDYTTTGSIDQSDIWADEDAGAWAGPQEKTGLERLLNWADEKNSLPGVNKNDTNMDNELGALGNAWQGQVLEDITGPYGFPATELSENADYPRSDDGDDGGRVLALSSGGSGMNRLATNLELVGELTTGLLKEYGKKDLTRRHVLAYLQSLGHPQFFASDIIRCLKLRHSVYIKDALDDFPIMKTASSDGLSLDNVIDRITDLAVIHRQHPDVVRKLRTCAAEVSLAAGLYDKAARRSHGR